ncbi:hypothetical protein [Candidatus Protochlamydia naegleriophila]|uniref:hypothetical protein n=1 Tax=Candidatus Protochlamydia naegleriophila TaxID=389348 RepID=UPI00073EFDE2|nr:hypothetical protein [Candidatus Protochlamydia naegleriophila]
MEVDSYKRLKKANDGSNGWNPVLAIILKKSNGLPKEKTGNAFISENVSGDVPKTGVEPATFALRILRLQG